MHPFDDPLPFKIMYTNIVLNLIFLVLFQVVFVCLFVWLVVYVCYSSAVEDYSKCEVQDILGF